MAKNEQERAERIYARGMLIVNCLGYLVSVAMTVIGIWAAISFDDCRRTFICDDDVIPPVVLISVGLVVLVLCVTLTQMYRRNQANDEREIRNPQPFVGALLLVAGLASLTLDVQQKIAGAGFISPYYRWLAAQSTTAFVVVLVVDVIVVGWGAVLLRRFKTRAHGYPYL